MSDPISHITFIVADLERMTKLLKTVLNAREVYSSGNETFSVAPEKFFMIGDLWVAIMQGESLKERSYNHIAFKIKEEEFDSYLAKIEALGLDMKPPRPRVLGEGRSIYFHDYDNHMFELHTGTLEERLKRYASPKKPLQ